jgi:preprotein translocase subunit SecG
MKWICDACLFIWTVAVVFFFSGFLLVVWWRRKEKDGEVEVAVQVEVRMSRL